MAAAEAMAFGWGGLMAVHRATGVARATIERGVREMTGVDPSAPPGQVRRPGGGRKKVIETDPSA